MAPPFQSFVVLAEMRTGSNLLEAALNALPGVACHGEAFNPAMIGAPRREALLGLTMAERDADPLALWARIRAEPGLNGCRYFHDHDPRMLRVFLDDPACAKIVLTRNPVESYVSLKIARATGQWKLGDAKSRKTARPSFDAVEFEAHLADLQDFQIAVLHALQTSGQTAFHVDYDDVQDIEVLNGLAQWLGVAGRLQALPSGLVPQNPEPLEAKVTNFRAMEGALARLDRFNLSRTPNFEPRRGPNVPGFVASAPRGATGGLVYMPIRPIDPRIVAWMRLLGETEDGFSQQTFRQWRRKRPDSRSFAVLRHPLMRAHLALSAVLSWDAMAETRAILRRAYKLPIPAEGKLPGPEGWADLLTAFLIWLKANLNGQTTIGVAPVWASQTAVVQGFAQFLSPDLLIREGRLAQDLAWLADAAGLDAPAFDAGEDDPAPVKLARIATPEMEKAAREAYPRDFLQFGFGEYRPGA